ncbi:MULTISPECIES: hypothetical protein [Photorhabdus]|uniref:hypothetical protein n=1 Tax=Photorhabdus TaxID=29487 RepID=UPI0003FD2320|nr:MULTISPECIES: hypothetical protein [Photorhabdus]
MSFCGAEAQRRLTSAFKLPFPMERVGNSISLDDKQHLPYGLSPRVWGRRCHLPA